MSDMHKRINKKPADGRPTLDFLPPPTGSRLRTTLMWMALLLAAVFVFGEYQPRLQKETDAIVHAWRRDPSLAENTHRTVWVAAVPALTVMEESNQNQLSTESEADDRIAINNLPAPDEVKTEIKQLPGKAQSQPPARRSMRVIAPTKKKSTPHANPVRAALPESKTASVDIGFVVLPEVLAERTGPQQEVVVPEVTFSRHGRLMERENE